MACVEVFNVGRLIHLYWLGVHWPEAFSVAHGVVWNVLAVLAGLAYLGTWLYLSGSRIGAEDRVLSTRGVPECPHPGRCLSL